MQLLVKRNTQCCGSRNRKRNLSQVKTSAKRKSYQYERILNKTHHCRLYYKNGISTVIYETMYWLGYKKTGKHETDTGVENLAMRLWKSFRMQRRGDISYYDTMGEFEAERFAVNLNQLIAEEMVEKQKAGVIFLCIGTDRSTGDSLGPLVGHKLRKCRLKKAAVIGTLDKPVHAMNLELYAAYIHNHFPNHVVVAIDASVGSPDHVGFATLGKGALQPGLGVSKELGEVGDISITGIVGGAGNHDPVMLQSVRLSMVMKMADCICESIALVERFWENTAII